MKKNLTKSQQAEKRAYEKASLSPLYIKFIDEYLSNGYDVGKAYHTASGKTGKLTKSSQNNGSRLLRYKCVKDEIDARLTANNITKDKINMKLWEVAQMIDDPKTVKSAVTALTTLAKIRGMIQADNSGDQFFQNNFLVYAPMVVKNKKEEIDKIMDKTRLIE